MTATPRDQHDDDRLTNSSIGHLLQQIVTDIQAMLRSEIRLAKREVADDAMQMGKGGGMLAAGALLGVSALELALLSAVYLLRRVMPDWLATLLISGVVGAIAGALTMNGRARIKAVDLVPREAMTSLNENAKAVADQALQG